MTDSGLSFDEIVEHLRWPGVGVEERARHAREALAVVGFWTDFLLEEAERRQASWHSLAEPALDPAVDRDALFETLDAWLGRFPARRWPRIGALRRVRGRADNHPKPADALGQLVLNEDDRG